MSKKWIPKDLKKGRLHGMDTAEINKKMARLHKKADNGKLSKEDLSYLRALQLGKRFKSKEFRKKGK